MQVGLSGFAFIPHGLQLPAGFLPGRHVVARSEIADVRVRRQARGAAQQARATAAVEVDVEAWNAAAKSERLANLEAEAMGAIQKAVENFDHAVFPCAFIAGDIAIMHMIDKLGYLSSGKVKVLVVDTFHLFPETMEFLAQKEAHYGFKAEVFRAEGCQTKADYDAKYGADLWKDNIEEYDRVAKVEPFQRGLKTLECDAFINGRRRDHGFERAFIPLFEPGKMSKINPIAFWTFEDCFDYLNANGVAYHPLHDQGYPSIGDAKDTVTVPKEKWFEYAGERSGRFQGLANKDGSKKTECGIHVEDAERTFERDLWGDEEKGIASKVVKAERASIDAVLTEKGTDVLAVVYAPWCQFCQAMEPELEALAQEVAGDASLRVAKYRGDTDREFVVPEWGVSSFPTLLRFPADGSKPVMYTGSEGDRTKAKLGEFLRSGRQP